MLHYKPPETQYSSMDDIRKYNMIWNVAYLLIPIFLILFAFHVVFGDRTWISSIISAFFALTSIWILYKTRKYEVVAIFAVSAGFVMCQFIIYVIADSQLISNVLWCVLISFFAFFVLNSFWGIVVLMLNLSSLLIYFAICGTERLLILEVDLRMIFDVLYVGLALGFVVHKMMLNNKRTNEMFEAENARNEVLLKEIHHRVKNNLQIISSLLKLQSLEIENEGIKNHFEEAIGRIRSMALIHEKMYSNSDLAEIDLASYLNKLAKDICDSMKATDRVTFNINSELEKVDIKSMVPISLLFNELITNSLKHGIKESEDGKIEIKIFSTEKTIEFYYADNGLWKPPKKSGTFGLELLETLANQLEGKVERKTESGTNYYFTFNKESLFYS